KIDIMGTQGNTRWRLVNNRLDVIPDIEFARRDLIARTTNGASSPMPFNTPFTSTVSRTKTLGPSSRASRQKRMCSPCNPVKKLQGVEWESRSPHFESVGKSRWMLSHHRSMQCDFHHSGFSPMIEGILLPI